MRRVLISTKPFIFVLFLVGVKVRSAESLSSAIPLGTSTKRANSKRANHGRSRLFQDAVSSVSFWLRSFPVCGWRTRSLSSVSGLPTRWRCIRGWLMRLLWAYEHDFVAISPFLYERIGTFCRHPCWSLCEQRIADWRSGRSEGYSKSLSAGHAPMDLLLLTQRTSRPVDAGAAHGDWLRSTSDESHSAVPREGDVLHGGPGAPSLAQPGRDERRRQGTLFRRPHLPGRAVRWHREGFAQQFSAIQQQTEAIQHTCPGVMHHPPLPPGPGLSPPVAVGTLLRPPELLAPGRIDTLAGASSLSQESGAPRVPVRPQVVQEVDEVGCAVGAACTASGGVAHAAQPVSLAHAHNSTRLRDSVRQATSQVQRRSRDAGGSPERPGLARGDCCPPGKGRNRAGPSSQKEAGVLQPLLHRTQETWWPSTNPGSASYEPSFTQAPSRCGHAGALSNASSPRIGLQRSTWRMLTTCFDPSATQTVPTVCVWRSGIAVQDPPLRAHEGRRKAPLPRYGRWASGSSTTSTIGRGGK